MNIYQTLYLESVPESQVYHKVTKTQENILSQKENLQKVGEMASDNYEINQVDWLFVLFLVFEKQKDIVVR